MNRIASGSDCVLDIGAHKGNVSQALSAVIGETGRIFSFECHPLHFLDLSKRAVEFTKIRPYCKAMSDRAGHSVLYFGVETRADQASTLIPELANAQRLGSGIVSLVVETDTVDQFCQRSGLQPTFMKVDVEGAESLVFAGAKTIVEQCSPLLVFEHGLGPREPLPWHFQWLSDLGYQLYAIDLYVFVGPVAPGWTDVAPAMLQFVPNDLQMLSGDHSFLMNVAAIPPKRAMLNAPDISDYSLVEFIERLPTMNVIAANTRPWRAKAKKCLSWAKRSLLRS
jgi:FkbM family methyltransferase